MGVAVAVGIAVAVAVIVGVAVTVATGAAVTVAVGVALTTKPPPLPPQPFNTIALPNTPSVMLHILACMDIGFRFIVCLIEDILTRQTIKIPATMRRRAFGGLRRAASIQQQAQKLRDGVFDFGARHDVIELAIRHLKLGALEVFRQLDFQVLFDDARAGKADERARFSQS